MMTEKRARYTALTVCVLTLFLLLPLPLRAQLRPLEPLDWDAFTSQNSVRASMRIGWFADQRASLAGVRGDLFEVGEVRVTVRTGRVLIEAAGTPQRFLSDEEMLEAPAGDTQVMSGDRARHDSGDYRIGTTVLFGDAASSRSAVLRFGTRLPTTDNRVGLDRDATDFFGLLGGQQRWHQFTLAAEAGVSINGTRISTYEQSDVLAYALSLRYNAGAWAPTVAIVGQNDLRTGRIRGNEDLMEVRAALRYGVQRWVDLTVVAGTAEFSPGVGVMLGGGVQLGKVR